MSRYGLRALADLALLNEAAPDRPRPLRLLAKRQQLPVKYLEQVFVLLRKAGFVESIQGVQGGYRLARPAHAIYLDQVIRILEGDIVLIKEESCDGTRSSLHRFLDDAVWQPLNQAAESYLAALTLADLLSVSTEGESGSAAPS